MPTVFKGTVSRDFLLWFFYESSSPKPLKITLGSFQIFRKIRGDIRISAKIMCATREYTSVCVHTCIDTSYIDKFIERRRKVVDRKCF
jgi:hypothetical protein